MSEIPLQTLLCDIQDSWSQHSEQGYLAHKKIPSLLGPP